MPRFDAVICDIDGCLGPESHGPLEATRLAALAEYNRLAHETGDRPVVTLCSGRPLPYADGVGRRGRRPPGHAPSLHWAGPRSTNTSKIF